MRMLILFLSVTLSVTNAAKLQTNTSEYVEGYVVSKVKELKDWINQLNNDLQSLKTKVAATEIENKELKLKSTNIETQLQNNAIQSLKTKVAAIENENKKLKIENLNIRQYFQNKIPNQKHKPEDKSAFSNVTTNTESFVGFTAYASSPKSYKLDERVLFDTVVRNYGNAYHSDQSVFECPLNGYYIFSVTVYTLKSFTRVKIYVDGDDTIVGTQAPGKDHGIEQNSASVMAVTYCEAGQFVWIKCGLDGSTISGSGSRLSSFSGALLYIL